MIVASGRSALTFNAAMSASSASTTIRSAFLLTLSPTVNCQDILAFRKTNFGYERALTGIDQTLRAWCSVVPGCCRVAAHSGRTPICTNKEWGGRWFNVAFAEGKFGSQGRAMVLFSQMYVFAPKVLHTRCCSARRLS
jgi:hypothetical protein